MSRLLETIKLYQKKLWNIEYHNERMNQSRKELYGCSDSLNLESIIKIPSEISDGLFKCRVIYTDKILDVDIMPYATRAINSLQIVHANELEYNHKYEDRSTLQKLLCKCTASDVIIIKNGFVTDTSYSNIVFYDGVKYFTPSTPLLKGTKREKLLKEGTITEEEIKLNDIQKYKSVFLINALMDIDDKYAIPIENII